MYLIARKRTVKGGNSSVRFGSLAVVHDSTIRMAAIEGKAVIGFDLTVLAQAKRPFLKCYCNIRGVTLLGAFGLLINRTLAVCIAADQRVCACLA